MSEYIQKSTQQLKKWFDSKTREGLNDFKDYEEFEKWYFKQEKRCVYCGLTEHQSQEIVMKGILKSNRFPKDGIIKQGRARGVWLEIDRDKPKEKYSIKNCKLSCYFCNNDKSDIFDSESYIKFRNDRTNYIISLLSPK
jgi:hypothetical protein